jgi:tRNA uridine 5-carbamoylmethylation protein Kti12
MKLAVTGKMCSGKTTLCNYLLQMEPRFQIFSFGKKVKEVASDLFGMDPLTKDRSLLISLGQKMREIDSEVWINYVIEQTKDKDFCLVDDLRYQNEYEALLKKGFKIIQLNISDELQEKRIREIYPDNFEDHLLARTHLSEQNNFQWLTNDHPHLSIDSSTDHDEIKQLIQRFIS